MSEKVKIRSINISYTKGIAKTPVESAEFVSNHGIKGDSHAGPWHRQVTLLSEEEIPHPHAPPRELVGVGRSDALARAPDAPVLELGFVQVVEHPVVKQDDLCRGADEEPPLHIDAARDESFQFLDERKGIDDHAVPQYPRHVGVQDA